VKDDGKYGRYESVAPPSFHNQIFEGPDTDIETELQLGNARHSKPEDATEDDTPSTSGRQIYETKPSASSSKVVRACHLDFCAVCILSCTLPDFCCAGLSSAVCLSSFTVGSSYWIRIISCLTFFFANNLH